MAEIAGSAQRQASALPEVNTSVSEVDMVTRQNAAMVEKTTAASHALVNEAEHLSGLVS